VLNAFSSVRVLRIDHPNELSSSRPQSFAVLRRTARAGFLALLLATGMVHVRAQQAGTNVNVLPSYPVGNTFPIPLDPVTHQPITATTKADNLKGDNYLQRQVEPTIASSTYNADHLLAAFGDFRQVDVPNDTGLPGSAAQGWIGYSRSYDRGKHWYGAMEPGFLGGTSAADSSSPLHGLT